ncbi:MAG: phenylalanine--tRNA ligase subunit beta [Parcubacteria group bacterium]|nr:phenylalanine--tRNA ligase subunit beta [Parcubacteria group bacterium]
MLFSYRWLQTYFNEQLPEPKKLANLFTFHSFEVEEVLTEGDDAVFEIAILPNRRHDCLSHRGIAREISVLTGIPLARDPFREKIPKWNTPDTLVASIDDADGAPRYMTALMRGVSVGESPDWLKERLRAIGQKPKNNIVDATNYVMFELGQPLHVFDAEKFTKEGDTIKIGVRNAKEGELITALGGDEYILDKNDLIIVDGVSDSPLGIAGIKGGTACEIGSKTKNIIIESANFNPARVRRTATRLGLRTDASLRFESGLAPEQAAYALKEVIMLIEKLTGATLLGVRDMGKWESAGGRSSSGGKKSTAIPLSAQEANKLLGTDMNDGVLLDMLGELNFSHKKDEDKVIATPPFERLDVETKEDLIEEVGRVYGYEKIAAIPLPGADKSPAINKNFYYTEKIRDILTGLGFSEVYTHAIGGEGIIALENPLAEDKKFLRTTLQKGLQEYLAKAETNAELLGLSQIKIFEIGSVFSQKEELMLGVAVGNLKVVAESGADDTLRRALSSLAEELHAKEIDTDAEGVFSPKEAVFTMPLADFFEKLPSGKEYTAYQKPEIEPRYRPISQFPFVLRDIAVFVPEGTAHDEVAAVIKNEAGKLLVRIRLFDEFKKGGKISYAFRLVFQSHEKTLTDNEVNEAMARVVNALNTQEGFVVR